MDELVREIGTIGTDNSIECHKYEWRTVKSLIKKGLLALHEDEKWDVVPEHYEVKVLTNEY